MVGQSSTQGEKPSGEATPKPESVTATVEGSQRDVSGRCVGIAVGGAILG